MDEINPTRTRAETAVALLAAEVRAINKRMDEITGRQTYNVERFDKLYSALEDRIRLLESSFLIASNKIDTNFKVLDDLRLTLQQLTQTVRNTKDEIVVYHDKDMLDVKQDAQSNSLAHDRLEDRVVKVESIMPTIRAIMWVGAALGASILALIWSIIIGKAEIIFK